MREVAVLILPEYGNCPSSLIPKVEVATWLFRKQRDGNRDAIINKEHLLQLERQAAIDGNPPPRFLLREELDGLNAAVDPACRVGNQFSARDSGGNEERCLLVRASIFRPRMLD